MFQLSLKKAAGKEAPEDRVYEGERRVTNFPSIKRG